MPQVWKHWCQLSMIISIPCSIISNDNKPKNISWNICYNNDDLLLTQIQHVQHAYKENWYFTWYVTLTKVRDRVCGPNSCWVGMTNWLKFGHGFKLNPSGYDYNSYFIGISFTNCF
jgi:hypothetical protein